VVLVIFNVLILLKAGMSARHNQIPGDVVITPRSSLQPSEVMLVISGV
jgi:hypothetical protein